MPGKLSSTSSKGKGQKKPSAAPPVPIAQVRDSVQESLHRLEKYRSEGQHAEKENRDPGGGSSRRNPNMGFRGVDAQKKAGTYKDLKQVNNFIDHFAPPVDEKREGTGEIEPPSRSAASDPHPREGRKEDMVLLGPKVSSSRRHSEIKATKKSHENRRELQSEGPSGPEHASKHQQGAMEAKLNDVQIASDQQVTSEQGYPSCTTCSKADHVCVWTYSVIRSRLDKKASKAKSCQRCSASKVVCLLDGEIRQNRSKSRNDDAGDAPAIPDKPPTREGSLFVPDSQPEVTEQSPLRRAPEPDVRSSSRLSLLPYVSAEAKAKEKVALAHKMHAESMKALEKAEKEMKVAQEAHQEVVKHQRKVEEQRLEEERRAAENRIKEEREKARAAEEREKARAAEEREKSRAEELAKEEVIKGGMEQAAREYLDDENEEIVEFFRKKNRRRGGKRARTAGEEESNTKKTRSTEKIRRQRVQHLFDMTDPDSTDVHTEGDAEGKGEFAEKSMAGLHNRIRKQLGEAQAIHQSRIDQLAIVPTDDGADSPGDPLLRFGQAPSSPSSPKNEYRTPLPEDQVRRKRKRAESPLAFEDTRGVAQIRILREISNDVKTMLAYIRADARLRHSESAAAERARLHQYATNLDMSDYMLEMKRSAETIVKIYSQINGFNCYGEKDEVFEDDAEEQPEEGGEENDNPTQAS